MFGGKNPNYMKLRTNLRLCINRLKLLEKKKTELALKARREIADYISNGKEDRARIRVEHIVREDYMVEAMEIVEMFCDLLLARYGMIEKMKEMDPGLEECIATIIWVTPRLVADVQELKEVSNQLTLKYGKEWAEQCRKNGFENVNEKVLHKLSVAAPSQLLIENYMVEIAKTYKVAFEPDIGIMAGDNIPEVTDLINLGGLAGAAGGGIGFQGANVPPPGVTPQFYPGAPPPPGVDHMQPGPTAPYQPGAPPQQPHNAQWPSDEKPGGNSEKPGLPPGDLSYGGGGAVNGSAPAGYGAPPAGYNNAVLPPYNSVVNQPGNYPPPGGYPPPPPGGHGGAPELPNLPDLPGLPSVPSSTLGTQSAGGDDVDFDDLTKRFEELKKKK